MIGDFEHWYVKNAGKPLTRVALARLAWKARDAEIATLREEVKKMGALASMLEPIEYGGVGIIDGYSAQFWSALETLYFSVVVK